MPLSKIQGIEGQVAPNLGRRNLIINGAMKVAQRGTSNTSGTNGYKTTDRFRHSSSGLDNDPTHENVDVASGTTPYSLGFRKAHKITNGNQSSGAGASDTFSLTYKIEAQDIASSGWDYTSSSSHITLSFWVKSSVSQNFYIRVRTLDGTNQSYVFETGVLTAGTWTKITKSIAGNSNLQFDNNTEQGLQIIWDLFQGTDLTDNSVSLNQWGAFDSALRSPDQTTTWYTTDDATFELTGIQLEVGEQATAFEHRSFGEELSLCSRYYHTSFSGQTTIGGSHPSLYSGKVFSWCDHYGSSPDRVAFNYNWPVQMRDIPTVTMYGNQWTSGRVSRYNGGNNEYTIDYASGVSKNGLGGYYDVASGATGDFVVAYVEASAEL